MPNSPKTLFFILENHWDQCQGGAELQAYYLEKAARKKGWRTQYFFLTNTSGNTENTRLVPVKRKRLWTKLKDVKYPYAWALLKALDKAKPDILYQRCGMAFTGISAYYAQQKGCPLFYHIASDRDVRLPTFSWKDFPLIPELKLTAYGIKKADTIIAQTNYQAALMSENYNKKAIVIPNGHPIPKDCKKNRKKLTILWIGNWKPVKQPEIFIKLVQRINETAQVRLRMIGRIATYKILASQARQYGIEVMGELPNGEVNTLLEKAHLLVNTSKHEGFSNTFIQAWMRKVPVVSLKVDPDHIIQNHGLGYCSNTFDALVNHTLKLITDHSLRETMGNNARKFAVEKLSLNNMDRILELMNNACG